MTASIDLLRQIARHQRARLAELQYAMETRADDLVTLRRLADDAAEELARTETLLKQRETESDEY